MNAIAAAIRATSPQADVATWAAALAAPMASSGITSARRIAMFIGQASVESAGFTRLTEDLDYTHVTALKAAWPPHFPVGFDPAPYLGNPEMLADYVYGGRADMGNTEPGDGWRFRGRGIFQLSGRDNYTRFFASLNRPIDEDWCATPEGAALSACWFWARKGLNRAADDWIISAATRVINGEQLGIDTRIKLCNQAFAALSAAGLGEAVVADPDNSADTLMAAEQAQMHGGTA